MKLAKWSFRIAGVWGLVSCFPLLFTEGWMGVRQPEFYYGFVCLNICWQFLYLVVSSDPGRYRPMMIPAFLAKASALVALTWLYLAGRVSVPWVAIGAMDGVFAALFLASYLAAQPAENKDSPYLAR